MSGRVVGSIGVCVTTAPLCAECTPDAVDSSASVFFKLRVECEKYWY